MEQQPQQQPGQDQVQEVDMTPVVHLGVVFPALMRLTTMTWRLAPRLGWLAAVVVWSRRQAPDHRRLWL